MLRSKSKLTCGTPSVVAVFSLALLIRLGLLVYGSWQDANLEVKFTDVDYRVFSDAADFVAMGQSPYRRATYRYSPLLAWILLPNSLALPEAGKLLFMTADLLCGLLHYRLLRREGQPQSTSLSSTAMAWLFNPVTMTVSTRGNAEALIGLIVLATLDRLLNNGLVLAGCLYGLAVHLKIYPAIYTPAIYLWLCAHEGDREERTSILPCRQHFLFAIPAFITFVGLFCIFYRMYGFEFLEHTYLYHFTRQDIKHNFSVYFYPLYLVVHSKWSILISLCAFLPQLILTLYYSWYFYRDLPFACLIITFAFVTFNKVCTSQYFLWYLALLPLSVPHIVLGFRDVAILVGMWLFGQGQWLLTAYLLEFRGFNVFSMLWLASVIFLLINVFILRAVCCSHKSVIPIWKQKLK